MVKIGQFILNDNDIKNKPVKLILHEKANMTDNGDGTFTIETQKKSPIDNITHNEEDYYNITITNLMNPNNTEIPNKEYVLQYGKKRGYRCISWHPHYIMTDWVKTKKQALEDGDNAINRYYDKIEKGNKNDKL